VASTVQARRLVRPLLFVAVYIAAALITRGLTLDNGFTAWYPPAGLVMAYLIAVGPRAAPTALAARLLNTAVVFPDAWRTEADGVIARALAITACYALGAHLLRQLRLDHARLRELGWFIGIGVCAVPLGASISVGVVSVAMLGLSARDAYDAARTVWIGDSVAVATIVPAALFVVASRAGQVRMPRVPVGSRDRRLVLLQLAALVLAPAGALVIVQETGASGFLCLAVVPVVWVALRGDLVFAAVGLLLVNVSLTVTAGVAVGATARLSELQVVMLLSALGAMYVAAVTHTQDLMVVDLAESERRYRVVVDQSPSLIVRFDDHGNVRFANRPAWLDPAMGVEGVVRPLQADWASIAGPVATGDGSVEHDWEVVSATGDVRWFSARLGAERRSDGELTGVVAMVTDLTPRRQVEAELDRVRWRDPLTGLVNRQRFLDLLDPLAASVPAGQTLGVAIVDIDGFKGINESVGHQVADRVLVDVAERLLAHVGAEGFAARLTADEFALGLPVAGPEDVAALGHSIVRELRLRVPLEDRHLQVTCSVGVACGQGAVRDGVSIFYDAESALHAAKEAGRDRSATFEAGHRLAAVERERRLALIHQALDRRHLVVHYQPIVDLESGAPVGVEALVRLHDPQQGLLLPGSFIDLVEEAALDPTLGALVLEQALRDLAEWPSRTPEGVLTMSVNVTSRQLTQPGYVQQVLAACERHAIEPSRVRLELTETMVMADLDAAVRALEALRSHGVTAALDDFGIGYSSMAYLQRLPVDVLKIDRSFVSGLPEDDDDRSIVGLVVGLARALGLEVTAEGIETDEQRVALLGLGCDRGQGFFFDRPVDATTIAWRLSQASAPGGV
jgi:diguanylate cyclase (GGDEF)-like protein